MEVVVRDRSGRRGHRTVDVHRVGGRRVVVYRRDEVDRRSVRPAGGRHVDAPLVDLRIGRDRKRDRIDSQIARRERHGDARRRVRLDARVTVPVSDVHEVRSCDHRAARRDRRHGRRQRRTDAEEVDAVAVRPHRAPAGGSGEQRPLPILREGPDVRPRRERSHDAQRALRLVVGVERRACRHEHFATGLAVVHEAVVGAQHRPADGVLRVHKADVPSRAVVERRTQPAAPAASRVRRHGSDRRRSVAVPVVQFQVQDRRVDDAADQSAVPVRDLGERIVGDAETVDVAGTDAESEVVGVDQLHVIDDADERPVRSEHRRRSETRLREVRDAATERPVGRNRTCRRIRARPRLEVVRRRDAVAVVYREFQREVAVADERPLERETKPLADEARHGRLSDAVERQRDDRAAVVVPGLEAVRDDA